VTKPRKSTALLAATLFHTAFGCGARTDLSLVGQTDAATETTPPEDAPSWSDVSHHDAPNDAATEPAALRDASDAREAPLDVTVPDVMDVIIADALPSPLSIGIAPQPGVDQTMCQDHMRQVAGQGAAIQIVPRPVASNLQRYDVVVLCESWAMTQRELDAVQADTLAYTDYVKGGGGLLIFQPNPLFALPEGGRITLLPAWFDVEASYIIESVVIVADHPLTSGFVAADMPYPFDRIVDTAPEWLILARGATSGAGSLAALELGRGRAAVDTDNHTDNDSHPGFHSQRFVARLLQWLARRI
jgi:hypothetical protein